MALPDFMDAVNFIDRLAGVVSMAQQGQTGRQLRVRIEEEDTNTMDDYTAVLDDYDVAVFYKRATSDHYIFNVRHDQWQWVVNLLYIAGAPVDHRADPWAMRRQGRMPRPWKKRNPHEKSRRNAARKPESGPFDRLLGILDRSR